MSRAHKLTGFYNPTATLCHSNLTEPTAVISASDQSKQRLMSRPSKKVSTAEPEPDLICTKKCCKINWPLKFIAQRFLVPTLESPQTGQLSRYSRQKSRNYEILFQLLLSFSCLPFLILLLVMPLQTSCNSIAPTIDYSHNMRILKLPKTTLAGSLIYRLKGSDGDPNTQLTFGVLGPEARSLLDILPVPGSWNEADVYLRSNLEQFVATLQQRDQNLAPQVNLTLFVTDGNMTTQIESTILITDPELEGAAPSDLQASNGAGAFVNTKHIFNIPENSKLDEPLGFVSVLESDSSELPVRFELRGKGAEKFSIRYVFGPRGQSRGELHLAQQVDYEKQNLFNIKILALNAWTDSKWDTRNVATMDIVITLSDVQDTAPIFRSAPSSLRVTNAMQVGDLVGLVEAEDGDLGDQRPIHFALDASSPLANYFSIDKLSGQIRLVKSMQELGLHAAWDSPSWSVLTVIASEPPDPASYDRLWPPMYSKLELPLMLVDVVNEPPQFLGGWQTKAANRQAVLRQFTKRNQKTSNSNQGNDKLANDLTTTNGHVKPGQQVAMRHETGAAPISNNNNRTTRGAPQLDQVATLHAFLPELSKPAQNPSGMLVRWYTNGSTATPESPSFVRPIAMDLGLGQNGTFQVHLEGPDSSLFRLEPSMAVAKQTNLMLFVADSVEPANWSLFDRDLRESSRVAFQLDLVARDFGQPTGLSSRIHCQIDLLDLNDNAPQFELDLYSFQVYENAQRGHLVGQVRARDPDVAIGIYKSIADQQIKYGPLTGAASNLFRVQPETGQIWLEGALDRERDPMHLLLVEVSDLAGNSNYTKILITVLDVNDNSPQFLQSHYDAVLLSDGTLHQPLQVKALDADEPGTANSQVAYEIIAGNRDEQFVIDSVSGAIYPSGQQPNGAASAADTSDNRHQLLPLPPTITTPIEPYNRSSFVFATVGGPKSISTGREIEETTASWHQITGGRSKLVDNNNQQLPINASKRDSNGGSVGSDGADLDSMMRMETTSDEVTRSLIGRMNYNRAIASSSSSLPPVITLIVRAHDFGIPLRSSTVRVNIYNQAVQARSISVILNGTAEQVEGRRDAIERAFSSLTGSRATIEQVESLSDSSSLCVAHFKLVVPQHNLVDLTDLSGLMDALDYRPHSYTHPYSHAYPPHHEHPTTGVGGSSMGMSPPNSHTSGLDLNQYHSSSAGSAANITNSILPEFTQPFQLGGGQSGDSSGAAVERRLLIYIIVVAICILSLLVIWMVYSCNNHSYSSSHQINAPNQFDPKRDSRHLAKNYSLESNQESGDLAMQGQRNARINKGTNTKHGLDDGKSYHKRHPDRPSSLSLLASPVNGAIQAPAGMNLLQVPYRIGPDGLAQPLNRPFDRLSMYNGQVWFEPMPMQPMQTVPTNQQYNNHQQLDQMLIRPSSVTTYQRRASSAPSVNGSLRQSQLAASGRGQFFPNARGYMQNLQALDGNINGKIQTSSPTHKRRGFNSKRRVAPMFDQAADPTMLNNASKTTITTGKQHLMSQTQRSGSISSNENDGSSSGETLILDSDQELLGFDLTGTPIIATLTDRSGLANSAGLVGHDGNFNGNGRRLSLVTDQNGEPVLRHRTQSPIKAPSDNKNLPSSAQHQQQRANVPKSAAKTSVKSSEPGKETEQTNIRDQQQVTKDTESNINNNTREACPGNHDVEKGLQVSEVVGAGQSVIVELNQRLKQQRKSIDDSIGKQTNKTHAPKTATLTNSGNKPAKIARWKTVDEGNKQDDLDGGGVEVSKRDDKKAGSASSRYNNNSTDGNQSDSTLNEVDTKGPPTSRLDFENQMKNGDLLKKQSIFALTYKQLAAEKLPTD